jgi:hypothetical protein
MAEESKDDDIQHRIRTIYRLHNAFMTDDYDVNVTVEGDDLVVKVFLKEDTGDAGASAGAGAGGVAAAATGVSAAAPTPSVASVGASAKKPERWTPGLSTIPNIPEGEEEPQIPPEGSLAGEGAAVPSSPLETSPNIPEGEEGGSKLSAEEEAELEEELSGLGTEAAKSVPEVNIKKYYDQIIVNYNTIIGLLKTYSTTNQITLRKAMLPINKSIRTIHLDLKKQIGNPLGVYVGGPLYKEYILNKLLNEVIIYFTDYIINAEVRSPPPDKAELLSFFTNEIANRQGNKGPNLSGYKLILNQIKEIPQVIEIVRELNNLVAPSSAGAEAGAGAGAGATEEQKGPFSPLLNRMEGGGRRPKRNPLRQTRKLRKSNK